MAKVIVIVAQKGGDGKSTTAQVLGVAAHLAGKAVVIFDMDTQRSVTEWKARRGDEDPDAFYVSAAELDKKLTQYHDLADWIIIDTPGRLDAVIQSAVRCSDLVIIPAPPKPKSLETVEKTFKLILDADDKRRPIFVLLNQVRPGSKTRPNEAREVIKGIEEDYALRLPICPHVLRTYAIYENADIEGMTPQEQVPDSEPGQDGRHVFEFTDKVLGKLTDGEGGKHGKAKSNVGTAA